MMARLVAWASVCPLASVTSMVKVNVPASVGVPDSTPVSEPRPIPAGRLPLLTDQVYGPVPPLAVSVAEYAEFTSPDGGAAKFSAGPAMMVSVVALVSAWPLASVTLMVKVPAAVGVPEMAPVEGFRVRPAGRVPVATEKV